MQFGNDDLEPTSTKPDLRSADWWKAVISAALDLAKATGVMHKKEGYDPKQDEPKDKDSGEQLY